MIGGLRSLSISLLLLFSGVAGKTCTVKPLGHGRDDTSQVLKAIEQCGQNGHVVLEKGNFNITRKMTWNLKSATVDLHGFLNFNPNIGYWLGSQNTYRVIFIQDQASWFVITGQDFVVDAHNTGGIQGNGQVWWNYYSLPEHPREDGDGRPVSLTLSHVKRGSIKNFQIQQPPFWCNAVADSQDVLYQGMVCNATNTNPALAGQNIVWNTDGIDTYRSDRVSMVDWDVATGDDCLAIKGNSTNIFAKNILCRGGEGVAFGSLGQYQQFNDIVENVHIENVRTQRPPASVQPNMISGVYFKTWTGSVHGSPPTGGGGGGGRVNNVTLVNFFNDDVTTPIRIFQTNLGQPGDIPSKLPITNLNFVNFVGSANNSLLIDLECSPSVPCRNLRFENFNIKVPTGEKPVLTCSNVINEIGLPGPCTSGTS